MGTTSSAIFSGTSRFSNDFQQVIQRAVSIASLPIQQMQNEVNTLGSQSSELQALSSSFQTVQSALKSLESASGLGSFSASVSDPTIASVALSGNPLAGGFSVNVSDIGAYASSMTSDGQGVTDPANVVGDATSYTLQVGQSTFTITPAANTLSGLADAIDQTSGANVQATLVNVGSSLVPDYRLSIQGTKLGDLPIQLTPNDGSRSGQTMLTPQTVGAPATYKVNGAPSQPISTDTRTVTVSPGVAVTMLAPGTASVTVTRNTTAVSNALTAFASAYNAAQAELDKNRGSGSGALKGEAVVVELAATLRNIAGYSTGGGGLSSLTALGFSFDKNGVLSFDPSTLSSAANAQVAQLAAFLGSSSTGGFLKAAGDAIGAVLDPVTGMAPAEALAIQQQIARQNQAISDQQDRVTQLQTSMQNQMAAADAAIAAMEQQVTYITDLFQSMQPNKTSRNG